MSRKSVAQMTAFDQLPSDLRRALSELDFNWTADDALVLHLKGWSTERICAMLVRMGNEKNRLEAEAGHVVRKEKA